MPDPIVVPPDPNTPPDIQLPPDSSLVNGITSTPQSTPTLDVEGRHVRGTFAAAGKSGHTLSGKGKGYRHFTFVMKDEINNEIKVLDLNLNPEDMVLDQPYRVNAMQTGGGAFVDIWGKGIRRLIIRGNTGWRTISTPVQHQDGYDNFFSLRDDIINKYHDIRFAEAEKHSASELNDKVSCTLVDRLHGTAYRVVPENFRLLRNKQRPLLHMYEAQFIIVEDDVDTFTKYNLNSDANMKGLFGEIAKAADKWAAIAKKVEVGKKLGKWQAFIQKVLKVFKAIATTFKTLSDAKKRLLKGVNFVKNAIIRSIQAVRNVVGMAQSLLDLSDFTLAVKQVIGEVKRLSSGVLCLLAAFKQKGLFVYTQHVGSSLCGKIANRGKSAGLASTPNSFTAMKQSQAQNNDITNTVNQDAQNRATTINYVDVPLTLIGKV